MNPAFPEHRLYSVLAALQVGMIMIGTFAIRFVTAESLGGYYKPAPAMAHWIRDWGYFCLLVPAVWLVLSIQAARKDEADGRLGLRIALGIVVTLLVGFVFWWLWNESTIFSSKMYLLT